MAQAAAAGDAAAALPAETLRCAGPVVCAGVREVRHMHALLCHYYIAHQVSSISVADRQTQSQMAMGHSHSMSAATPWGR